MKRVLEHLLDRKLLRYFVSGGTAFIVDYATLLILTEVFGVYYLLSATAGFILGSLTIYLLSVKWIFDKRRFDQRSKEISVFFIIGITGLAINNIILWYFTDRLGVPYQYAKLIAAAMVMLYNYFARLFLVFTPATEK